MITLPPKYAYLEMHSELEYALDAIQKTNDNLFICGAAGTGKSELIKLCSDKSVYNHNTIVCCPTGIAAVNASTEGVKASTIHSVFKLPPLSIIPASRLTAHDNLREMFNALHTLIIDEISMVNSDLLTKVVYLLNEYRQCKPVRFIVFGDPSQLAPIIKEKDEGEYLDDQYGGRFFFHAEIFKTMRVIPMTKIFRQQDPAFKDVLNRMRMNNLTDDDFAYLNTRVTDVDDFREGGDFVHIAMTNKTVDRINNAEVASNKNMLTRYIGDASNYPENELPVPLYLELKLDTQVMIVANDLNGGYYNGQLGRIVELGSDYAVVHSNGTNYRIGMYTWQRYTFSYDRSIGSIEAKVMGNYTQLPIKIAYAITSHKAQGLTLERVYVDFERGTFSSGQAYTALSRCKTLEGTGLARRIRSKDIKLSPVIRRFYKRNHIWVD